MVTLIAIKPMIISNIVLFGAMHPKAYFSPVFCPFWGIDSDPAKSVASRPPPRDALDLHRHRVAKKFAIPATIFRSTRPGAWRRPVEFADRAESRDHI
jgi:hypothetical protein